MSDFGWMVDAKCRDSDPALFDADDPTPAALLCAGCGVRVECGLFHTQPINVTDYIERVSGETLDEPEDLVYPSQVKAMGIVL